MSLKEILVLCAVLLASRVDARENVCYWIGEMGAAQIDGNVCTQVCMGFIGLNADGSLNYLWRTEAQVNTDLASLRTLRTLYPHLRITVSLGGWNPAMNADWSAMASTAAGRTTYANNVLAFVQAQQLNGVVLDWEYPNFDGSTPGDIPNFVALIDVMRSTLSAYYLSVSLGAGLYRFTLSWANILPEIYAAADSVGLMTYDMHGDWTDHTGIHGALYGGPNDPTDYNADYALNLILNNGGLAEKTLLGIPSFGIGFTLASPFNSGVGALTVPPAPPNTPYRTICTRINVGTLNEHWEAAQMVPYAVDETFWVGYDNVQSVAIKGQYILDRGLLGAKWWVLDDDDYSGICGGPTFPLFRTVANIILP